MYKIYFDCKVLVVCENASQWADESTSDPSIIIKHGSGFGLLQEVLADLKTDATSMVVIETPSPAKTLEELKSIYTVIQAGGGFVYTESKKLLFIFRRSKWDLPKGKLDDGETLEECSLREVTEETGINNLQLGSPLATTYHTYAEKVKQVLKESHWFLMKADAETTFTPQLEEDIESCEWVPFADVSRYLSNTHGSIKDVVEAGLKALTS